MASGGTPAPVAACPLMRAGRHDGAGADSGRGDQIEDLRLGTLVQQPQRDHGDVVVRDARGAVDLPVLRRGGRPARRREPRSSVARISCRRPGASGCSPAARPDGAVRHAASSAAVRGRRPEAEQAGPERDGPGDAGAGHDRAAEVIAAAERSRATATGSCRRALTAAARRPRSASTIGHSTRPIRRIPRRCFVAATRSSASAMSRTRCRGRRPTRSLEGPAARRRAEDPPSDPRHRRPPRADQASRRLRKDSPNMCAEPITRRADGSADYMLTRCRSRKPLDLVMPRRGIRNGGR